jgi:transposase
MQTELEMLRAENLKLQKLVLRKDKKFERLEEEIRLHLLKRFGRRSEEYVNPLQPSLFNEIETEAEKPTESVDEVVVGPYVKARDHRKALPEFLPRERIEHDLPEEEKFCTLHGQAMEKIGEDISEQLEIVPEQIKVLQHVRPKYKCPCCEGSIKQVLMPKQPIQGSIASPSLLAFIAVSKYQDHLPLYRLESKFERIFVDLPRLTMARWMIRLGEVFTPIYNFLQDELLSSGVVQMDETTIQVLKEEGRDPSTKSYMWVRARDGTTGPPIVLFDYFPTRSASVVQKLLGDFSGTLQTDGYSGYDAFSLAHNVKHAGCLAHARRRFWEAFKATKKSDGLATVALDSIKRIYAIESQAKAFSPDERLAYRKLHMAPVFSKMQEWLLASKGKVPATLKTGEAIAYALDQWPKLVLPLEDGRLPLDTNFIEGRIRPFTIGRKNWIFSDTPAGAHASAMIYSIIETAKANRLEPFCPSSEKWTARILWYKGQSGGYWV